MLGRFFSRIARVKNNLFTRRNASYSQFGEDIVLQKLLKEKDGFYVDVGAYHPKRYSNTYLLWERGWRGINIDPNKESIILFNKHRPRDINILAGIANEFEEKTLYTFSHSNWDTFSKEKSDAWRQKPGVRFLGEQKISCFPLRDVLKKHLPTGIRVDLLNIDAEGMDVEVLKSNDWVKYTPRVIVVESAGFNPNTPQTSEIYSFLNNKSYSLYAFMGVSLIFVKNR